MGIEADVACLVAIVIGQHVALKQCAENQVEKGS
jgi:hypothetical protein